jgi:hypothetical protein
MNQSDPDAAKCAKRFSEMLENPPLLPDPVFPKENYLRVFGTNFFQELLRQWQKPELIPQITSHGATRQMIMLRVGWMAFWAFDFEEKSEQGVSGRDEFRDRVKEPIRRPPANMAAFTMEQHLLARGVFKIQIAEGPALPGEYQICKLKTIGWYAARLVSAKG